MENRYFLKECKLVPTEGSSLKQEFEISAGNPLISYYESIKSPAISLTLTFLDVDQLVSREGITGGEYLSLKVKKEGHDDFEIKADKHFLMLNSVKDVSTSSSKQVATLEFVSVEAIINETARVNKKYTGNVTQTVKELLKGRRGIETKKNLDSDRASNSYSFVGNLKRPFDTIQWLCSKTQSSKDGYGFLFFETADGYVFKSIEKLLKQKPIEYKKSELPDQNSEPNDFRIIENNLDQTNDIGINCRMGMYANKTIYINVDNATYKTVDFRVEDLKLKKSPKLPNKLERVPTRLMLRVLDKGALQKGSKRKEIQKENELAIYQSKSYARANLIFSQSMSIVIPFNPDLRAGQMLDLKFPLRKGSDQETTTYGKDSDDDVSGKYLISELKHTLGNNEGTTQLKLIRDVFTA
tara:strand:+ start:189 stop:1421 length:1233 start_codon:yes stop_codon:yes gene_type:complete